MYVLYRKLYATSIQMHISNIHSFLLHIYYNAEFPTTYFKTNWDYKHQTIDDRQDINIAGWIRQQITFVYLGLNQTWSRVRLNVWHAWYLIIINNWFSIRDWELVTELNNTFRNIIKIDIRIIDAKKNLSILVK